MRGNCIENCFDLIKVSISFKWITDSGNKLQLIFSSFFHFMVVGHIPPPPPKCFSIIYI